MSSVIGSAINHASGRLPACHALASFRARPYVAQHPRFAVIIAVLAF